MTPRPFRFLALLMLWCASQTAVAAATGVLVIEGGGASSQQALQREAALIGAGKRLCVITTANPGPSIIAAEFKPLGVDAEPIKVAAANAGDPAMAAQLALCDGFYFDGGLPRLLSDAFLTGGRDTLAMTTIRQKFRNGAMIAGTSAGAMMLGTPSLCTCATETSFKVLHGAPPELSQGFGFVGLPIDAHVFTRNLYGRELATMALKHWPRLLAIDESTAVEVPGDGSNWRVLGDGAAALIEAPAQPGRPYLDYDISFLHRGDLIDPASFEAVTDGRKEITSDHEGPNETLQEPFQALPAMALSIAQGAAEAYDWDGYWDPVAPVRLRLALNERSRLFENGATSDKAAYLMTHLALSAQVLSHEDLGLAVTGSADRLGKDWGVSAPDGPRKACIVYSFTPVAGPGMTTVDFEGLKARMADRATVLINALGPQPSGKVGVIGASQWLSGAGECVSGDPAITVRLGQRLAQLTQGDLDRPLVFYCLNELCWHSYNAAQRARLLGYRRVYWYRGGLRDWTQHGGALGLKTDDC